MKEILGARRLKSKIFKLDNGGYQLVARTSPMHYDDNGTLKDIDMTVENKRVHKCSYDVSLYADKIGYHGIAPDGKAISLILDEPYVEPVIERNVVKYPEVSQDCDLVIIFQPGFIRVNRVLKTKDAKKTCKYKVKREAGIVGKLLNLGVDAEGRKTKLNIAEQPTGEADEIEYTQEWTGEVSKRDRKTRKRKWSNKPEDIKYPVVIDPTSTFTLAANPDDGNAFRYKLYYTGSTPSGAGVNDTSNYLSVRYTSFTGVTSPTSYPSKGYSKNVSWLRFAGITIPQSTTIDSATLKVYCVLPGIAPYSTAGAPVTLRAVNTNDPANPTNVTQALSPATATGTKTTNITAAAPPTTTATQGDFGVNNLDVKDMIQALVNNFDYSNEHILLHLKRPLSVGTGGSQPLGYYAMQLYQRDWGTTRDSELVIAFGGGGGGVAGQVDFEKQFDNPSGGQMDFD